MFARIGSLAPLALRDLVLAMAQAIPMVDPITMLDPIPMVDSILMVVPIPMVKFRFWYLAISFDAGP